MYGCVKSVECIYKQHTSGDDQYEALFLDKKWAFRKELYFGQLPLQQTWNNVNDLFSFIPITLIIWGDK